MAKLDPYQQFIKKGEQTHKRLRLQLVDIDGCLCDSCNQKKKCAIIQDLTGHPHHVCLECLEMYVEEVKNTIFNNEVSEALMQVPLDGEIQTPSICMHGDENNDLCDECLNEQENYERQWKNR